MIIEYKVKCDECGKIINAKNESFIQNAEGETLCMKCVNEKGE